MIPAALALVASLSMASADLAEAEAAFTRGDYVAAESLAAGVAPSGPALYLVGLARFRQGRPAEALEALDAAGRAEDPPEAAAWQFNRGACLYELERYGDAEAAFVRAAELDASLSAVALANAGFAALDGGAPERAKELAGRARAAASDAERGLVADLEAQLAAAAPVSPATGRGDEEYAAGMAAFDAGEYESARDHFERAAELEPDAGRNRLMAGAAKVRLGATEQARADFHRALELHLEDAEAEIARDYLDALVPRLGSHRRGFSFALTAGGGFDSNVPQLGVSRPEIFRVGPEVRPQSPLGVLAIEASYRWRPGNAWAAEFSYAAEQLSYVRLPAVPYNLQQHVAMGAFELGLPFRVRVGASVEGDAAIAGPDTTPAVPDPAIAKPLFRAVQAGGGGAAWIALDESDATDTRLDLLWSAHAGMPPFSYLSGPRLDAVLSQELRLPAIAANVYLRYRRDDLGILRQLRQAPPPLFLCPSGCEQHQVIPLAYSAGAAGLSARALLGKDAYAGADATLELRSYAAESFVRLVYPDGSTREVDHRLRQDLRFAGALLAGYHVTREIALELRYDLLANGSNVDSSQLDVIGQTCGPPDFACHLFDYGNMNFQKHEVALQLRGQW